MSGRPTNNANEKSNQNQRKQTPAAFGGRFPGTTELSVISEGSYRTSQDGTSFAASSVDDDSTAYRRNHDDASSTGLSVTEDEKGDTGVFRNYYAQSDNSARPKLTASALASNSRILGMNLTTGTMDDEDDDNLEDEQDIAVIPPQMSGPVTPISTHLERGKKERRQSSQKGTAARPPYCSSLSATPLWLRLAVVFCFLLVLGSVACGVVASFAKKGGSNSNDQSSQGEDQDEFLQYRVEQLMQQATPSPSPSPGLRG